MDAYLLLDGSVNSAGALIGQPQSAWTNQPGNNTSANIHDVSQLPGSASGLGHDVGVGNGLWLVVQVLTAYTSGGSPTLQVNLQYAPDNGSGSPGSWVTMQSSAVYALSQLTLGAELMRMQLPPYSPAPAGGSALPKFIQMSYAIGSASFTAGALLAAIVEDRSAIGPLLAYKAAYSTMYC
ncbi:MAG: Bbp16 family capsid cement protein [Syntrophobacteraceae bacterium]